MAVWVLRLGKSGGRIDAESCGYQTWKQQSRAERTEWEHLSRANHQYHSQLIHGQLYSLWNETMSASSYTTLPYSQNYRAERSKDRTPAKPHAQPEDKVPKLEAELAKLRKTKREIKSKIEAGQIFERHTGGFQSEASEHIDRLLSIKSLPKNVTTGEWQWPFAEKNLAMETPIARALIGELASLEAEMQTVMGQRPQIQGYLAE